MNDEARREGGRRFPSSIECRASRTYSPQALPRTDSATHPLPLKRRDPEPPPAPRAPPIDRELSNVDLPPAPVRVSGGRWSW